MRKIAVLIMFVFVSGAGKAQNRYADSIKSVLAITMNQNERFDLHHSAVDEIFTK